MLPVSSTPLWWHDVRLRCQCLPLSRCGRAARPYCRRCSRAASILPLPPPPPRYHRRHAIDTTALTALSLPPLTPRYHRRCAPAIAFAANVFNATAAKQCPPPSPMFPSWRCGRAACHHHRCRSPAASMLPLTRPPPRYHRHRAINAVIATTLSPPPPPPRCHCRRSNAALLPLPPPMCDVDPLFNLGTQHNGRSARTWMKRV